MLDFSSMYGLACQQTGFFALTRPARNCGQGKKSSLVLWFCLLLLNKVQRSLYEHCFQFETCAFCGLMKGASQLLTLALISPFGTFYKHANHNDSNIDSKVCYPVICFFRIIVLMFQTACRRILMVTTWETTVIMMMTATADMIIQSVLNISVFGSFFVGFCKLNIA